MGQIHLGTCTGNAAPDGPYSPFDGRPTPTTGCTVDALRTDVVVDCGVGNVVRRK